MDTKDSFYLSDEVAEWVGLKKSEYLSKLIIEMSADDFSIEEIYKFEHLIPQTIQEPDRVFEDNSDSYPIRTYIRTYSEEVLLHQIVMGALIDAAENRGQVFVPFLIFVTKKEELARSFSVGSTHPRKTLN